MKRLIAMALGALWMSACATAQQPTSEDANVPGWLEKDFAELVSGFDGRWDNDRHVFFAADAGMDVSQIAPSQHLQIERVDPASELVAEFSALRTVGDEAPTRLIHRFSIDANASAIRQAMFVPDEDGSHRSIGCDVIWARRGAQFEGRGDGEGCAALFPRPAGTAPLDLSFTLSEADYWVTARRGDKITEARFRRARPFECWTAILRGAEHGDSGEGMNDWDFRRGVTLHDQGGEAELITDETPPRRVRLRLRNVDWPYGTNRPSLTLYVLEGESDRAVSYAWNEGDAERIGINLRWLQASCTYAPDGTSTEN